jgi:predicted amidohydrolase YtcJ
MRTIVRIGLGAAACAAVSGVAAVVLTDPESAKATDRVLRRALSWNASRSSNQGHTPSEPRNSPEPPFPLFSTSGFENAGYPTACRFTGPIEDRSSIAQVREAIRTRAQRGADELRSKLRSIRPGSADGSILAFQIKSSLALLSMYAGRFDEAADRIAGAMAEGAPVPRGLRANLEALLGVIHLRRGETENCLDCRGPSSCIFPIARAAVHQLPSGSRAAIQHFRAYLKERPEDLGVRWLLNVAYMTLGEYPDKVPAEQLIKLDPFVSRIDVGRFENIAAEAGLGARGANMVGGSVFDDFTGDGLPDILTSSFDVDLGGSLFINRGDGTFENRSLASGLASQPLAVNATQADFDNDGKLDVLLMRGGWEKPSRLSLLRNKGSGVFEDVTVASGLAEPIASHAGAWGDFDNDGHADLFVCGEFAASSEDGLFAGDGDLEIADRRNRCRLYRNRGDGTFTNVAEAAGVCNDRYAKGAAWGDYNGDGFVDLYVANYGAGNRLYRNNGNGTFQDVAPELGVTEPRSAFSCWWWDHDNDGRLDLFVTDYGGDLQDFVASALHLPTRSKSHPRLYRNLGAAGFRDVSLEAGLDRVLLAMGSNFADIDNDGFLDFYLGTGLPGYSALIPNLLFKNIDGRRFEDVTASSGTGHLQKGHGVSFADADGDGDVDLFVELGGAVPGDQAYNALFRNPGHARHWLKLKLVGTRSNRSAFGAKIRVDLAPPLGARRSIHRQVGGGSSYGGNTLVETIGLGNETRIDSLNVYWPASRTNQTFHDIAADQSIQITEGSERYTTLAAPRTASEGIGPRRNQEAPADMIVKVQRIWTGDQASPWAEALAARQGVIVAVGPSAQVMRLRGPSTRVVERPDAVAMPGLIDAHGHMEALGASLEEVDLRGVASVDAAARMVKARSDATTGDTWITGRNWDQSLWPGGTFPTALALDAVAPGRPVWLERVDGHAGWANSEAMRRAKVVKETQAPSDGQIIRDRDGQPTGVFIDGAMSLVGRAVPAPSKDDVKRRLLAAQNLVLAVGLTGVHDAGISRRDAEIYRELERDGKLVVRVYAMASPGNNPVSFASQPPPAAHPGARFELRAIKLFIDGAMGSRGALLFEPYHDDPANSGLLLIDPKVLEATTMAALRHGWQVCTHAIGDRGNALVLDAYAAARKAVPEARDPRLRIEHAQVVRKADVRRFADLGVIASMQPSHASDDMRWADARLGQVRAQGAYAWRWFVDAGVSLACGSDFPVEIVNPFWGIYAGLTRQDTRGAPPGGWHAEQVLTLEETLRGFTAGAAHAAFADDRLGILKPGYRADLTILDRDPFGVTPKDVLATRALVTIVDGAIAFEAGGRSQSGPGKSPGSKPGSAPGTHDSD